MKTVAVILFPDFETLDVFGPVELLAASEHYQCRFYSENGGLIGNRHHVQILTSPLRERPSETDILLIPGGAGTRSCINDSAFLEQLREQAEISQWVLSVCTGSALLAATGLLDGREATSNKRAWEWVIAQRSEVRWQSARRWCVDGNYYTSSGVSAGMDMTVAFIADQTGTAVAEAVCKRIEYRPHLDPLDDPFARD